MDLEGLSKLAQSVPSDDASVVPWFRLDRTEDIVGLLAWFGADADRRDVKLVIRSEDAGWLGRQDLYNLVAGGTLGFGDALPWTLPGTPTSWQPYELLCPVSGCPPCYAVRFDPAQPSRCPRHHEQLRLAP